MAVDDQYLRIRRSLEEKLGVEEAFYLMDRPVGGWSELVTNQTLGLQVAVLDEQFRKLDERFEAIDARFEAMDVKFDARFDAIDAKFDTLRSELTAELHKGLHDQTWKFLGALVASMTGLLALIGAILAVALRS